MADSAEFRSALNCSQMPAPQKQESLSPMLASAPYRPAPAGALGFASPVASPAHNALVAPVAPPSPVAENFKAVYERCSGDCCACTANASCHINFCAQLRAFGLTASIEDPHLLFHARRVRPESETFANIRRSFDEQQYSDLTVFEIENVALRQQYQTRKEVLNFVAGNANERVVYHSTKANLIDVCNEGLDPRRSSRGFFGWGIYLAESAAKANDYSPEKGNPGAMRVILQCRVLLGRTKEYEMGHFDREIKTEPKGYHSVTGFIRRDTEYAVYNRDQVIIERVILYRFKDTKSELDPCLTVPPNVTGQVVFITASLSEFFSKLQQRAGPAGSEEFVAVKRLTASLLKQLIDVDQFLAEVGKVLKAAPPAELATKIREELERSKLGENSATSSGVSTSAPRVAQLPPLPRPLYVPPKTFGPPAGLVVPGSTLSLLAAGSSPLSLLSPSPILSASPVLSASPAPSACPVSSACPAPAFSVCPVPSASPVPSSTSRADSGMASNACTVSCGTSLCSPMDFTDQSDNYAKRHREEA